MARFVKEWVGKTDDTAIPARVKLRIIDRQGGKCAICSSKFTEKLSPEFDHIIPLKMGGENREGNIQAIIGVMHNEKTSVDRKNIAKADRIRKKSYGISRSKSAFQGGRNSKYKKKIDGTVVERE